MPEASGNGWLVGGIVGGVIMTIGIGVLTSMVIKGKNDNHALVENNEALRAQLVKLQQETGTPIELPVIDPVKETVNPVEPIELEALTPPEKLTKQIEGLKTTREQIVSQATELIRSDLAK